MEIYNNPQMDSEIKIRKSRNAAGDYLFSLDILLAAHTVPGDYEENTKAIIKYLERVIVSIKILLPCLLAVKREHEAAIERDKAKEKFML